MCTKCMEMRQLRERDKASLSKRKNGSTLNNNYGKPGNSGRCRSLPYDVSFFSKFYMFESSSNVMVSNILVVQS
jgi:hypothetical protein